MDQDHSTPSQIDSALLHRFFQQMETPLSAEDQQALTPILSALKHPEKRYDTPELIGEGGEKRVFRVYDQHLNRYVAMAQAAKAESELDLEQFLREGQLTANLTHPNIVPIHNMGLDKDGTPFFSMQMLPGDSLKDIINKIKEGEPSSYRERYSLNILLNLFSKVCDAVAYAHARNVLHLDIKPSNINMGEFGEVFLCDWGLAQIEEHREKGETEPGLLDGDLLNAMTLTGTMKGTPGFMAPEQVTGREKTFQTDVYALGAILYLILTHELPVNGNNPYEVMENTRKGNVIHPRKRTSPYAVQTGLAAVTLKALALDPADRYSDVKELQSDLNRFLTGFPTEAQQADLFTRMALLTQRHRRITFLLMFFSILLAVVMSINLSIIQSKNQIAEQNFSLYRQEQEEANRINRKMRDLAFNVRNVRSYINAPQVLPVAEQMLKQKNIDLETIEGVLLHKARVHLLLQQFGAAADAFGRLQEKNKDLIAREKLCQKYALIKSDDDELLSDHDLALLFTELDMYRALAVLVYYHDRERGRPANPEAYIQVAGAMLARLNGIDTGRIPDLKLTKRREGYHLDLSHMPYVFFVVDIPMTYQKNVLEPLQLYSLDLSHSQASLTRELLWMKITELRMVGVFLEPTSQLSRVIRDNEVKRLILGKGDYSDEIIEEIRDSGVEVVEEEYEPFRRGQNTHTP